MSELIIFKVLKKIKNIFFDSRCIFCNKRELKEDLDFVCESCYNSFFIRDIEKLCPICKHPLNDLNECPSCKFLGEIYYDSYDFVQFYTGYFKNILKMLKMGEQFLIIRLFCNILLQKNLLDKNKLITVVPDFFIKRIKKGRAGLNYLLKLLNRSGFKTINNIFKKKINFFRPQKSKNKISRVTEIRNMYYLPEKNRNKFNGEIYLIDDLYTTGSTVNYCAKLLKDAGFSKVYVVTFFRAIMEI
ncbi:MAG TPA: hypothetical protein PLE45_03780 [Spirochaetota bacterium]|nr:hypothetical protein [Spirochaetota bacterium]HOL56348.1 hypothetical protein [Spirochaetota bacterium]HPP03862.1 hypothetical protein [Spirochaetota bacterium]